MIEYRRIVTIELSGGSKKRVRVDASDYKEAKKKGDYRLDKPNM